MLGLKETKNSGSGWIEKQDGYSDKIICQLKSTDQESIKIRRLDIEKLENDAVIEHKIPVFAIQFINKDVYIMIKPENIDDIHNYLHKTKVVDYNDLPTLANTRPKKVDRIKSSEGARNDFNDKQKKKYAKANKTANNYNIGV